MNEILNYVVDEGLIMVPVLYILAEFIKGAEVIDSKYLPPLLTVISIGLTPLLLGGYSADNIVQSVLVTGMAVLLYETKKETFEGGL